MAMNKDDKNRNTEEVHIPLIEEQATVSKVVQEGKTVTVQSTVVTKDHLIEETLRKESVELLRVPHNTVVDEMPVIREENGITIIPVVEERLVVRKELVLVEEIHMHRHSHEEPVSQTISLSQTHITIKDA